MKMKARDIVKSVADTNKGDYSSAFKILGFLIFLAEEGPDAFLSGDILSPRTYHRWIESLRKADLEGFALDARMRQLVSEYIRGRFDGLPIPLAREKVLETLGSMMGNQEARSPQAISRQASAAVKGLASGREAKLSALDNGAHGGSLGEATAPSVGGSS
jgi:hypothetical protein